MLQSLLQGAFAVGQNHARAAAYSLPNLTPSLQQLMADGQQVAAAATALAAPPPPPPPPPRNQRNQRTAPAAGPADMKQSSSAPNFAAGWISQTQPGNDGSQAAAMHTPSAPPSLCWLDGEEPASNPGSQTPHLRAGDQPAPPAVPGASLPVLVGAVPGLYHAFATAPPPLPPGSSLPAYRPPPMQMFQPLDGVTGCSPGTPHPHLPPMPPAAAYMQHSPPGWLGPPGWDMALHLGQQDLLCGSLEDLTGEVPFRSS